MDATASIIIRRSTLEPAARCVVCAGDIGPGEGLTARYGEATLRFKCADCLARFEDDPDRYLAGHAEACCGEGDHAAAPVSEWFCDR